MAAAKDPTQALCEAAAVMPDAVSGSSCNQTSFKAGKAAFLYVGPGAKGVGFKAMFKLGPSLEDAEQRAAEAPERFEVGKNRWVTARFSAEKPLPKTLWKRWLQESYAQATGGAPSRASAKTRAARRKTR